MTDIILILLLAAVLAAGGYHSIKHLKGQGGCCGGGNTYVYKKKLKNVTARKTFRVEGMSCENCAARVTNALNDLPGVAAKVSLRKKEVAISMEQETAEEVLIAAIEKCGYRVIQK